MVGQDAVDDVRALFVFAGDVGADLGMGAFHLVVDGLADVMQQAAALGQGDVRAQLGCHDAGQMGHFDGVLEHVLAVGGAELQAAQQLDQLGVQAVDVGIEGGLFALLPDALLHLAAGFFHHLFDAARLDAAVQDQLFQGHPGNLAADGVETGEDDRLRRVVDDQVNAGHGLQRADVAALAADDAALHFLVGQGHHGHGGLGHVVCGHPLDGGGHDLPGPLFALLTGVVFDIPHHDGGFVLHVLFYAVEQHLLGVVDGEAGDLLQLLQLLLLQGGELGADGFGFGVFFTDAFFLLFDAFQLTVYIFFFFLQALFLPHDLVMTLLVVAVGFAAQTVDLFLGFQKSFFFAGLAFLLGVDQDLGGGFFRGFDAGFGQLFTY